MTFGVHIVYLWPEWHHLRSSGAAFTLSSRRPIVVPYKSKTTRHYDFGSVKLYQEPKLIWLNSLTTTDYLCPSQKSDLQTRQFQLHEGPSVPQQKVYLPMAT